jgi:hypothetical protein
VNIFRLSRSDVSFWCKYPEFIPFPDSSPGPEPHPARVNLYITPVDKAGNPVAAMSDGRSLD